MVPGVAVRPHDPVRLAGGGAYRSRRSAGRGASGHTPAGQLSHRRSATRPPGSFLIGPGLLPGSYHVVAIEPSVGSGIPTDRATLKALAPRATPVTIEAGRTAVVELRLTTLPGGAEERK